MYECKHIYVHDILTIGYNLHLFFKLSDPAEIIQTRYNEGESHYEYYVHYEGYNRRLDEWVPRDRIMSSRFDMSDRSWKNSDRNPASDLLADSSDRKITRNQKRRHDEINHIQKVFSLPSVYSRGYFMFKSYLKCLPDIQIIVEKIKCLDFHAILRYRSPSRFLYGFADQMTYIIYHSKLWNLKWRLAVEFASIILYFRPN